MISDSEFCIPYFPPYSFSNNLTEDLGYASVAIHGSHLIWIMFVIEGWNLRTEHGCMPRETLPVCGILRNYAGISEQPLALPNGRSSLSLCIFACV